VRLADVADIKVLDGPAQISRESGKRRIVIGMNVKGRDLGGFVAELQKKVEVQVKVPSGYYLEWGGQFQNMQRAMGHLMIIVPITVAAIFFLLFILFNSLRLATLIITVLPFASIGGVIGLFVSGEYLSVPASVGFIALWGIAVLNGVVLVSYIRKLREEGLDVREAARQGATMRFRPVMMTATVALLGLVPFLFSTGPGSEVQRPLAIVVIGGSSPPPCSPCSFCQPSTASSTANRSKPEGPPDDRDQGRHPPRKARHPARCPAPVAAISRHERHQGRRLQRPWVEQAEPAGIKRDLLDYTPKVMVVMVAQEDSVDVLCDTIHRVAHTGRVGDGLIWTTPVGRFVRITAPSA
jgi:nitrogen regulatory protein PII